jgi:TorA maturation chaperone TorD
MSDRQQPADAGSALARAAAYTLLAAGLRFPDDDWASALEAVIAFGQQARRGLGPEPEVDAILDAMSSCCDPDVARQAAAMDEVRSQYAALFGHAVRGKCPPYELEYGAGEIVQRAPDLADIAGFYAAFGLAVAAWDAERCDHASVEFEFMSILSAKEAHAIDQGDAELLRATTDAQRLFLRDHLATWIPAFARRLATAAPEGLYAAIAGFLQTFLPAECVRVDVPPGPVWLDLSPAAEDAETPFECGVEESAPGARDRYVALHIDTAG